MADRNIKIKLTADLSAYVAAIEQARVATSGLVDILRSLGIAEADIPDVIKTVVKFSRGEGEAPAAA